MMEQPLPIRVLMASKQYPRMTPERLASLVGGSPTFVRRTLREAELSAKPKQPKLTLKDKILMARRQYPDMKPKGLALITGASVRYVQEIVNRADGVKPVTRDYAGAALPNCPRCGQPKQIGRSRCVPCAKKIAVSRPCPDCGGDKLRASRRCSACHLRARKNQARREFPMVCEQCGQTFMARYKHYRRRARSPDRKVCCSVRCASKLGVAKVKSQNSPKQPPQAPRMDI